MGDYACRFAVTVLLCGAPIETEWVDGWSAVGLGEWRGVRRRGGAAEQQGRPGMTGRKILSALVTLTTKHPVRDAAGGWPTVASGWHMQTADI